MEIGHWNEVGSDDSWDSLLLGGEFIPGVCAVECEDSWKIDFQKPKGKDGYKVKDEGYTGADVDITITLITKDDLDAFAKILPTLRPAKQGGKRQPLTIEHPSAMVAGISAIAIERLKISMPDPKRGWVISIKAKEWLANPKDNSGLGGLKGGGAHSCAYLASQLQQKHYELNSLYTEIQFAQSSGLGTPIAALKVSKVEAQIQQLQAQLDKCQAGGAVAPPSQNATESAATPL